VSGRGVCESAGPATTLPAAPAPLIEKEGAFPHVLFEETRTRERPDVINPL